MCYCCQLLQMSSNRSSVPTQGVLHINVPFAGKFEEREVLVKFLRQEVFRHKMWWCCQKSCRISMCFWCFSHGEQIRTQPINLFMPANCVVDDPGGTSQFITHWLDGQWVGGQLSDEMDSTHNICQNSKPSSLIIYISLDIRDLIF